MAKELENIQEKMNWHWRNSMRTVRFLNFDARVAVTLPVLLVYARPFTITITVISFLIFRFLETKGLTFPAALRNLRSWATGRDRPGWLEVEKKKFQDYG